MNIKIKIHSILPTSNEKQRNIFEEVALFLDCLTIQDMISRYRQRINFKHTFRYEDFDKWKESIMQDTLTQEEHNYLHEIDTQIDQLENRNFNLLNPKETKELEKKRNEKLLWLDPYYTFSNSLQKELTKLGRPDYFDFLVKAIVCGEVRLKDISLTSSRKGARNATHPEREAYWQYVESKDVGYGTIGRKLNVIPETITSRVNSYKRKLNKYEQVLNSYL